VQVAFIYIFLYIYALYRIPSICLCVACLSCCLPVSPCVYPRSLIYFSLIFPSCVGRSVPLSVFLSIRLFVHPFTHTHTHKQLSHSKSNGVRFRLNGDCDSPCYYAVRLCVCVDSKIVSESVRQKERDESGGVGEKASEVHWRASSVSCVTVCGQVCIAVSVSVSVSV
jgi:hypothetical protein